MGRFVGILPKLQLLKEIQRFCRDKNRGISLELFADLSGMSLHHFRDVFINELHPMTEEVQRRVDWAFKRWQAGEVGVFQNRDNTKFVQFRKEAKPAFARNYGLEVRNKELKLKIGIKNRADYSQPTLDEQLRGNNG